LMTTGTTRVSTLMFHPTLSPPYPMYENYTVWPLVCVSCRARVSCRWSLVVSCRARVLWHLIDESCLVAQVSARVERSGFTPSQTVQQSFTLYPQVRGSLGLTAE
jgi:hypothetical protein